MKSARKPETKDREQPQEGTHMARLLGITDLGEQPGFVYEGKSIESQWKFEFTYELVNHTMEDGRPFVVSEEITNKDWEDEKTGRASKLVARAKALAGKEYKACMKDLTLLLGKPCMVTVTLNDKGYAKLQGTAAIGSIPFGMEVKDLHNEAYIFDMDDPDMDRFESMPDFKKEKLQSALNFNDTALARILAEGDQY